MAADGKPPTGRDRPCRGLHTSQGMKASLPVESVGLERGLLRCTDKQSIRRTKEYLEYRGSTSHTPSARHRLCVGSEATDSSRHTGVGEEGETLRDAVQRRLGGKVTAAPREFLSEGLCWANPS
ncbi:hypothetical protein JHW43_008923 [Diplocarpon mali]|nr:hypothetical protein JHW43_008923 [Diplocarpon mali]